MRKKNDFQTTLIERLSYPLFGVGQGMVYLFVTGYLMLYYTNHIYIDNLIVAQILLFSKVWDAINDPIFGVIVDRVQFKKNKFKPWLRLSTPLIPLTTMLMFQLTPDIPSTTKVVLAVAFYLIWDVAYTISDVPLYSMITTMTSNIRERTTLMGYGSIAGIFNVLIISVVLVPRIETWGFGTIAIIIGIISFVGMAPLTLTAKERVRAHIETPEAGEKSNLRDIFTYLKSNKDL